MSSCFALSDYKKTRSLMNVYENLLSYGKRSPLLGFVCICGFRQQNTRTVVAATRDVTGALFGLSSNLEPSDEFDILNKADIMA
ncbi:12304_t:CDS:2 [Acaulospora colombiana]|uniref:12304_t:CDS:1 n=1 Tax=Acaulospora colombiana TaxID=27376 RepID=A0ACA9N6Q8_9GLOM|nr:12304_t:CDS:2 [Acaulospora colombiana]